MNTIMASIFNLAGPDMLVILLFVLLMFGAKKLPELARGMGRAVKEFIAAREEIERELTHSDSRQPPELKSPDVKMGIPAVGGILD
jgi:sec-independent protein translocase protein TatA